MDRLDDVAVFVRVVDSGSFTAAADKLEISKSVVSKYVTRLEDQLGARLLNRTTRRLSLTEAGRVLYERSRTALADIEDAASEVSSLQGEPRGTLSINAPMSFGILHVAPALPRFMHMYPELKVSLKLDDRKLDVIEEGFDVSIRITDMPDSTLVARRIAPCQHAVVAAPGYLEKHGTPQEPKQLADHTILAYQYQESALHWQFQAPDGGQETVVVSAALTVNSSLALREMLLGCAGIARTPTFVVGGDIRAGRLVRVVAQYGLPEVSVYVVYPARRHLSAKVRAFVEFMAATLGDVNDWH